MKRIFIAINLPEKIKDELVNVSKEIQNLFPEEVGLIRWTAKDNLHITLSFIGDTKEEEIPKICENIKNISQKQKPFSIKIEKICYGPPNTIPPRMIWAEITKGVKLLSSTPHITLGRIKTWQWKQIEPEERPNIERELNLKFEAKSIDIMESILKRTGAEYRVLESIPLFEN